MKCFFILAVLIINIPNIVKSFPFREDPRHVPIIPTTDQLKFMQRFGYLEGGQDGFAAQYTENAIHDAILNIQMFGGIEQTGIIDAKTRELMSKRRCGVKDIIRKHRRKKRFVISSTGWKKREITYFISSWSPQIGKEGVAREIKRALDMWAGYGNLTFVRTNNPSADVIVAFNVGHHGDSFPFDGAGNILAHAFFPYVAYGGNVHFDNDESWTMTKMDDEDDSTDFFTVAVHELGHTMGLGHSEVPTSIMFPYYKGPDATIKLDHDDVMAMYELYIRTPLEGDKKITTYKSKKKSHMTTTQRNVQEASTPTTVAESTTTMHSTSTMEYTTKMLADITYHENREDHKRLKPKHIRPTVFPKTPDICKGGYDAVSVLRQELFVFKENNVWRLKVRGKIENGYPVRIHNIFPNLPQSIKRINAAYERLDGSIAFFTGSNYWIYTDNAIDGPFSLSNYELPNNLGRIDATFIWKNNEKTYLFKGDEFWRYNEKTRKLDGGYPKNMTRWRGIPRDIDAAITWTDGSTYFFKGLFYWRFDNTLIRADKHYPLPAPQYWFGCPENLETFQQLPKEILSNGYMHH